VYLNFEQDEGEEHVKTGFSKEKFRKLTELKAKYDPGNLFRVNQNIPPAS
jgi:Berberine and berberine like